MSVNFGSKAETLLSLQHYGLNIPEIYYFDVRRWNRASDDVLAEIRAKFSGNAPRLVVRSSSCQEDGGENSMAGAFRSVLGVCSDDQGQIKTAIEDVIDSYGDNPQDQILVQPMVEQVKVSGVIMTHCLDDGSPYYSICYDDESGRTDSVTGGTGVSKTVFVYRGVSDDDFDSPRLRKMVGLARELEGIFGSESLDIEFGLDAQEVIHLFQVRRICTTASWRGGVGTAVSGSIRHVEDFVRRYFRPRPGIHGGTSILGAMPDWNPAEIIGVVPRRLAASLYREIITRRVWSRARERMGYRAMPPEELMVMVAGRPYIDVRNSFNSFLPGGLPEETSGPLVDSWLDRLSSHPELHDKIEFEIATTVHDPCFDETFARRYAGVLPQARAADYKAKLLALTNSCLKPGSDGSLGQALTTARGLDAVQNARGAVRYEGLNAFEILSTVRALLEECRRMGTLPFSIVARHAFIAEAFLRAAVCKGAISQERVHFFKRTVKTVAGEMSSDIMAVCRGEKSPAWFGERYGHLRPGTYDILSPRYADRPELFGDGAAVLPSAGEEALSFEMSSEERRQLSQLLASTGIDAIDAGGLLDYARQAIAGREYAKFVFTRNLSDSIEGLAAWGELSGLDREQVANLELTGIMDMLVSPIHNDLAPHFRSLAEAGQAQHDQARSFKLSYLIRSPSDVYIVPQHRSEPNFITGKRVEAPVAVLHAAGSAGEELRGRIACIENADPGFDWIFTKGIVGLVTKYGGTNSHMAIRCAEYGLPAAIGAGEMLFERIAKAARCEINAGEKTLTPSGQGGRE